MVTNINSSAYFQLLLGMILSTAGTILSIVHILPISNVAVVYLVLPYIVYMDKKQVDLRKVLSQNIKKQREFLGLSQERLAEHAEISSNMLKDIEGCRTWVSDKTLIKIASALKTDIYRLFVPASAYEEEMYKNILNDLLQILHKMKKDIDHDFEKAFKMYGLK